MPSRSLQSTPLRNAVPTLAAGLSALLLLVGDPLPTGAQQLTNLRVFLDCNAPNCDSREFRTEIQFVDWVNEPAAADVHVLMTSQESGGGRTYFLDFIGMQAMSGLEDRLRLETSATDTRDEVLRRLTQVIRLGLVRFVAQAGLTDRLEILARALPEDAGVAQTAEEDDPWRSWVFRVDASTQLSGEERESQREFSGGLSANRTTEEWKIDLELDGESERREVELSSGDTFENRTDDWEFSALMVRSLGPRWGAGSIVETGRSTNTNRDFFSRAAGALEWNYYPYAEANRRQFVVQYQVGIARIGYEETTFFDRDWETLGDHLIGARYDTRQPWGEASASVRFSTYLHDPSLNRGSINGDISFRIARGLSLSLNGRYERIRDQIYLSARGLSDEEILIRRGEQATGYDYWVRVGFSYRFGSIFSNVINSRFPGNSRFF